MRLPYKIASQASSRTTLSNTSKMTEQNINQCKVGFGNALLSGSQGLEEVLQIADFAALGLFALVKCTMAEV